MKGTQAVIRSALILLLCSMAIVYTKVRAYIHATTVYFCNAQSYVSTSALQEIAHFVEEHNNYLAPDLVQALHTKFDWIQECSLRKGINQAWYIDLVVAAPDFVLTNNQVVAHNSVVAADVYVPKSLQSLPRCTIFPTTAIDGDLISFLYKIPLSVWQNYDLFYHSWHDIKLCCKDKKYIMRCNTDYMPTEQTINSAINILEQQKTIKGIRVADIRFKDQLILYAHTREIQ